MDGRGLGSASRAALIELQVRITSRSIFSPPGTDPGGARAMQLSWTPGWGRLVTEHGVALFHVGREEGCENYAVAFLDARTAIVAMSVSPVSSTFSAELAAGAVAVGAAILVAARRGRRRPRDRAGGDA